MRANFAAFENVSYHLNATPLSVAVLVPCAWSKILACGGAWQSIANSAKCNTAWCGEFDNETAQRGTTNSTNSATQHSKFSVASVAKWAVLVSETSKAKMGQCLGGGLLSLSLSLSLSLLALFGKPLRSI